MPRTSSMFRMYWRVPSTIKSTGYSVKNNLSTKYTIHLCTCVLEYEVQLLYPTKKQYNYNCTQYSGTKCSSTKYSRRKYNSTTYRIQSTRGQFQGKCTWLLELHYTTKSQYLTINIVNVLEYQVQVLYSACTWRY